MPKPGGELVFRVARDGAEFDAPLVAESVPQGGRPVGIVHIHDLLRAGAA